MLYNPIKVDIPYKYHKKIKNALKGKSPVSVKVNLINPIEEDLLLLTKGQISKMERARLIGKKSMTIRLSPKQVEANTRHEGGFLGMLIAALSAALPSIVSAATAAAPAVLASAATGAISGAISKAVSGDGLYFQKNGNTAKVQPVKGGGLYLSPYQSIKSGDGLFLKNGGEIYGDIGQKLKTELPILEILL